MNKKKSILSIKKMFNKKRVLIIAGSLLAIVLVVAAIFVTLSLFEGEIISQKGDQMYIFESPFANSDDNTGNSKMDDDNKTTYFKPYRNHISDSRKEINGDMVDIKGWAIWGLYVDELKETEKYRITATIAIDTIPEDKTAEIAEINIRQSGLDNDGHYLCTTPNDFKYLISADEFEKENEFKEISMDIQYNEFDITDIIHYNSELEATWPAYEGDYEKGKLEIRLGWGNETVGIKIQKVIVEKLSKELEKVNIKSIETLTANREYSIKTSIEPVYASKTDIEWESTDKSVAEVNNGIIYTKSKGKTTIKAKGPSGSEQKFELNVTVPVEKVSVDENEKTMRIDDVFQINANIIPAENQSDLTWSTSDENIAIVENGKITAITNGIVQIEARAGDKSDICTVYVCENFKDVIKGINIEDWAYDAISKICAKDIMEGTGKDIFEPVKVVLRKDFLLYTARLLGYEENINTNIANVNKIWPFEDKFIKESEYEKSILFLFNQKIFEGIKASDGKLYVNGDEEITRQEALFILGKTIVRNKKGNQSLSGEDIEQISDWAAESIKNIISNGIEISVKESNKLYFKPNSLLTRQEAADFLNKLELNIESVSKIPNIKLVEGQNVKMPDEVKVILNYNIEEHLNISWNQDDINKIKKPGTYKVNGTIAFRKEIKSVNVYVIVEKYVDDNQYGSTLFAGYCNSKEGTKREDFSRVRVLPVGSVPGVIGTGDHGVWGAEYSLKPGRYIINFVVSVDKSTATREAGMGEQIARINPRFIGGYEEAQVRSITLADFEESNVWYNINCELTVSKEVTLVEVRLWYNNNVSMKVREIEVFGISKTFSKVREDVTRTDKDEKKYGELWAESYSSNANYNVKGKELEIYKDEHISEGVHGVYAANFDLKPGKYLVNFVMQVDRESATEDVVKNGTQIARINPAFGITEEAQLRIINLSDFQETGKWVNIICEITVPDFGTITEMRIWYNNNINLKVREIQIYGIDAKIPEPS